MQRNAGEERENVQDLRLEWLTRLTGCSKTRFTEAVARVDSWGLRHVSEAMGPTSSFDGHVAALLLCESVDELTNHGVPWDKLRNKLRRPDVWSVWAELRVGGQMAYFIGPECEIELDVKAPSGRDVDLAFRSLDHEFTQYVEVKALGLSYEERQFCQRYAPLLRQVVPKQGFFNLQSHISEPAPILNRADRRDACAGAQRAARRMLPIYRELSATTAVAHGTREEYVKRLARKVSENLLQLPEDGEGWIAFHWGNGAPDETVQETVELIDLPDNIAGVMFVGSVVILGESIHHFWLEIPKTVEHRGTRLLDSRLPGLSDDEKSQYVEKIMGGCEQSASVRAMVLRARGRQGLEEMLVRDGTEDLWPFNFILEPDPPYPC